MTPETHFVLEVLSGLMPLVNFVLVCYLLHSMRQIKCWVDRSNQLRMQANGAAHRTPEGVSHGARP